MSRSHSYHFTIACGKNSEERNKLILRCRQILRGQGLILCRALQKLKLRAECGQKIAGRIWDSLIDGLYAEVPLDFFDEFADYYFWHSYGENSEELNTIRNSLEQALKRKWTTERLRLRRRKGCPSPPPFPSTKQKTTKTFDTDGDIDLMDPLLYHLLGTLQMAVAKTDISKWNFKKEEKDLIREMQIFNQYLKIGLELFLAVKNNSDIPTVNAVVAKYDDLESQRLSLEAVMRTILPRTSADAESCSSGLFEDKCNDDKNNIETDVVSNCSEKSDELSETSSDDSSSSDEPTGYDFDGSDNQSTANKQKRFTGIIPKAVTVDQLDAKLENADNEGYIIRHSRSVANCPGVNPKWCPSPECAHIGHVQPTSHYRDWKRDGYRCICGQQFSMLRMLDKHIYILMESRIIQCKSCDYKINRRCCMEKHMKDEHERPKMLKSCRRLYQCMYGCEKIMQSKFDLFAHQKLTSRCCLNVNNTMLPKKDLPVTAGQFMIELQKLCDRSNVNLNSKHLSAVLKAAEADATRMGLLEKNRECPGMMALANGSAKTN